MPTDSPAHSLALYRRRPVVDTCYLYCRARAQTVLLRPLPSGGGGRRGVLALPRGTHDPDAAQGLVAVDDEPRSYRVVELPRADGGQDAVPASEDRPDAWRLLCEAVFLAHCDDGQCGPAGFPWALDGRTCRTLQSFLRHQPAPRRAALTPGFLVLDTEGRRILVQDLQRREPDGAWRACRRLPRTALLDLGRLRCVGHVATAGDGCTLVLHASAHEAEGLRAQLQPQLEAADPPTSEHARHVSTSLVPWARDGCPFTDAASRRTFEAARETFGAAALLLRPPP